jgi:hypothetical protein
LLQLGLNTRSPRAHLNFSVGGLESLLRVL